LLKVEPCNACMILASLGPSTARRVNPAFPNRGEILPLLHEIIV
jgi:hypothetical protein